MAEKLIINPNGTTQRVAMTNTELLALTPKRITITLSKISLEADGMDSLTLEIQLMDGTNQPITEAVTFRAVLPDHTWQEFTTDAHGYCNFEVDAVWPKKYEIQIIDPAGVYADVTFKVTATGDYPGARGSAQFTLGEAWRQAAQDQAAEAAEVVSLEETIADANDLAEVKGVLERMARQIRLVKHYGRLLWHVNTEDITAYLER